jgi:hypothetical protein
MSFTYNQNIPNAPNAPSADQPLMEQNTNSNYNIWTTDHITFNNTTSGMHQWTQFPDFSSPVSPVSTASVMFPAAGSALNTRAQLFFKNSNATFPLSMVKAFGVFATTLSPTNPTLTNQYNVASITGNSTGFGSYTITLNSNVTSSDNVAVFLSLNVGVNNAIAIPWSFASNVLTLTPALNTAGKLVSFLILQI